jgi:hypothetical protein
LGGTPWENRSSPGYINFSVTSGWPHCYPSGVQRVCPRIALGADRRTASNTPRADHHCLASDPPARLPRAEQARLCLTASHVDCPLYRASLTLPERLAGNGPVLADYVPTRFVVQHDAVPRGIAFAAGRERRDRGKWITGAALLLFLSVPVASGAAASLAGLFSASRVAGPVEVSATPSPAPPTPRVPSPTPSPMPVASPSPSATPSASPTPEPTPEPTPTPQAVLTYVVRPGDTLHGIAAVHGTTVAALVAANGLASADVIVVEQRLVIPQTGG